MSEFLVSLPLRIIREHVLDAANRRVDDGGKYTEDEAALSLLVDVDREAIRSKSAYGRIWGWSRHKVRYNWEDTWQQAARWASSYGRQMDGPLARKLPEKWRRWLAKNYRQATATLPPNDRHPTATSPPEKQPSERGHGDSPPPNRQATASSPPPNRQATATHTIHPSSPSLPTSHNSPTDQDANPPAREGSDDESEGRAGGKEELVQVLKSCGMEDETTVAELVENYSAEAIMEQVASYRWRCENDRAPTSAGWIKWALEQDEPLPPALREEYSAEERRDFASSHRCTVVEPDGEPADRSTVEQYVAEAKAKADAEKARKREEAEERKEQRNKLWPRDGPEEAVPDEVRTDD